MYHIELIMYQNKITMYHIYLTVYHNILTLYHVYESNVVFSMLGVGSNIIMVWLGTMVGTGIYHPMEFDFYLCSKTV